MKNKKMKHIAGIGMLTAVAVVLQYLEISVPFVPSFIKLDLSDLPSLLGAFAYGPIAGAVIALLKNLVHLAVSQSGFVGELSNFLLGAVFALVAGGIYRQNKSKKTALLAGTLAAIAMAAASLPLNYYVVYPVYYRIFAPEAVVLSAYQAILPSVTGIFQALLIFNLPFTFIKGLLCVGISMLIYKPLSKLLK